MHFTTSTISTLLLAASTVSAVPWGWQPPRQSTHTVTAPATTTTHTITVTSGAASTSYSFMPGDPPLKHRRNVLEERAPAPQVTVAGDFGRPQPQPTVTVTPTSTITSTTTVAPAAVVETVYPCSNSSIAYGTASSSPNIGGSANNLYGLDTTEGASAQSCCNTCMFGIENCVQAWWYFYEGCVVQQASPVTGSGESVSEVCPSGLIDGLTYGNDTNPAFHSTGNIIGPCGTSYTDL